MRFDIYRKYVALHFLSAASMASAEFCEFTKCLREVLEGTTIESIISTAWNHR
jgi:hypothetical protein